MGILIVEIRAVLQRAADQDQRLDGEGEERSATLLADSVLATPPPPLSLLLIPLSIFFP